MKYHRG
jgi:CRP-like cAMP-binding protein